MRAKLPKERFVKDPFKEEERQQLLEELKQRVENIEQWMDNKLGTKLCRTQK
jgi:hypothetical protein